MGTTQVSISVVSCRSNQAEREAFCKLVRQSAAGDVVFVQANHADFIFIVGILETNAFENLRKLTVWRTHPEKCFIYCEADNPPSLLHGLCSAMPRWKHRFGRFQTCGYHLHAEWVPNPPPAGPLGFESEKRYLLSFLGRRSHSVRRAIFARKWPKDIYVHCTNYYQRFNPHHEADHAQRQSFWQILRQSKFALCPRGAGVSSIRLFEAMRMGVAPIIISDGWVPPIGPRWTDFALFVRESDIGRLEQIVRTHESEWIERGRLAYAAYIRYFSETNFWPFIKEAVRNIQHDQLFSERWFVALSAAITSVEWCYQAGWAAALKVHSVVGAIARLLHHWHRRQ
jgi:Exostosin family